MHNFKSNGATIMAILVVFSMLHTSQCMQFGMSADFPSQKPVIGILTQTHSGKANQSYIAASYVKFVQMSGAQVVPIFMFNSTAYIDNILPKINGVIFPGGGMQFDMKERWTINANRIFQYAKAQNQAGKPFPVMGVCLGFQLLSYLTGGYDPDILSPVRGEAGIVNSLDIVNLEKSRLYGDFTSHQLDKLTKGQGITYYNHHWIVSTATFNKNQKLKDFWNVISYSTSPYNEEFVSTIQSKKYPFFGVQFHPEKNLFQWKVYADRSTDGTQIIQTISNKFVQYARNSPNKFANDNQYFQQSIYQYKTSQISQDFSQIYIFAQNNKVNQNNQTGFCTGVVSKYQDSIKKEGLKCI